MDIVASVELPAQASLVVTSGPHELVIEDLSPPTKWERLKLAFRIIKYNRQARQYWRFFDKPFGDEHTPYHFWNINYKSVWGG